MTTFTTEDRQNASPPHIVDSGASTIKTLGAYIDLENRIEMYREQLQVMQAEIQRLRKKLMEAGIND
jgi:predicted nuclease with TOPRIM domain